MIKGIILIISLLLAPLSAWGYSTMATGGTPKSLYTLDYPATGGDQSYSNAQAVDTVAEGIVSGSFTAVDTGSGTVGIDTNRLKLVGGAAWNATGYVSASLTRSIGKTLFFTFNPNSQTASTLFSFQADSSLAVSPATNGSRIIFNSTGTLAFETYLTAWGSYTESFTTSSTYSGAIVLGGCDSTGASYKLGDTKADFAYGATYFMKGGSEYPTWTMTGKSCKGNTATLYNHLQQYHAVTTYTDNVSIPVDDLSSVLQPGEMDSFEGTTGDTLGSGGTHQTDIGGIVWHKRTDECAGGTGDSVWAIDDAGEGYAELTTTGSSCTYLPTYNYIYVDKGYSDLLAKSRIKCSATVDHSSGLFIRGSAETANGVNYWAVILYGDTTTCDVYFYKYVDGTPTTIYSNATANLTNGAYHDVAFVARGQTIELYINEVLVHQATGQTFNQTATRTGLFTTNNIIDKAYKDFVLYPRTSGNYSAILSPYQIAKIDSFDIYNSGFTGELETTNITFNKMKVKVLNPYQGGTPYKTQLHVHTNLTDYDSIDDMKDAGYDVVALTNYDAVTADPEVADITYLIGAEMRVNFPATPQQHNLIYNYGSTPTDASSAAIVSEVVGGGGLVHFGHPQSTDYGTPYAVLLGLSGYYAIEMSNAAVGRVTDCAVARYNDVIYDYVLSRYRKIFAVSGTESSDPAFTLEDCVSHEQVTMFDVGWVMVFAPSSSVADIVNSLRKGNFYASTGPTLTISHSNGVISVACDSASTIEWITQNGYIAKTTSSATSDTYTITGNELYVRLKVTRDSDSLIAWSNPFWVILG